MTYYVVVTRDKRRFVVERFYTIEAAANKIVLERAFDRWTVLAQDGGKGTPMRELHRLEKRRLESKLYPSLFDD